jgi:hypothetical protein
MRYKCVILDWNGTLLDDAYFSFCKTAEVLRRNGLDVPTFEYYQESFVFPVEEFLMPLGLDRVTKVS